MAVNMFSPSLPQLPHPEIALSVLLIIEEGIRRAWELLRKTPPLLFDLASANEDEITQQLRLIICNQVLRDELVPGFTLAVFRVGREAKYENFNGSNTEKMPDLVVEIIDGNRSVGLPSDDGLFIECKPVDRNHPAGATYCDSGLIRFVEGSYAWTMSQAMMIGYTCKKYTIASKLHAALKNRPAINSLQLSDTLHNPSAGTNANLPAKSWCEPIYATCHMRPFSYEQTNA